MSNTTPFTRREFIQFSATVAAMLGFAGCTSLMQSPRKAVKIKPGAKVRFAQIGCGGKGYSDAMSHKQDPNPEDVVALCDIDWAGSSTRTAGNLKKLQAEFPNAKFYSDFRKMLVEMDDQIDAVG